MPSIRLVSAAVIAVGFVAVLSSGLIFKRGRHGSGSLRILKGTEAFEAG